MERFSTSPWRNSFSVETCQKVGSAAWTTAAAAAQRTSAAGSTRLNRIELFLNLESERARAADGVRRRDVPFAERRVLQRPEAPAVPIRLHHREDGRGQRRERFALDDRAAVAPEQADVEPVVLPRAVEHADHLGQAARLERLDLQLA